MKKYSGNFQNFQNSLKCDNIPNEDELNRKISEITEEHLSNIVPVIADLMSLIKSNVSILSKLEVYIFSLILFSPGKSFTFVI